MISLEDNEQDTLVLKRVPETGPTQPVSESDFPFLATIIDLETMGLDPDTDEIIELGMLSFRFSAEGKLGNWCFHYNGLQQPSRPIPEEITRITGIRDQDVQGQHIDWSALLKPLQAVDLIVCHNCRFDRNFLEKQTPLAIQNIVTNKPFGCTVKDIDWRQRGFESAKLDYLNFKLGYFYQGHRALNDCFATFNLLRQAEGAFGELKENVKRKQVLLVAEHAPFDKKDLLKHRGYRWSDGQGSLPKGWWCAIEQSRLSEEQAWLDNTIYQRPGVAAGLPQHIITAKKRYSSREAIRPIKPHLNLA